ncbi:MAG TPA: T6SS effector amidase Tae4 family protein [Phenylobacterium sp.]|nr:T6SS effector amidase Tae4 family protein [Phenylobacterium sp.]
MTLFDDLWANHPANETPPVIQPCMTKGVSNHDNQCVIRLGIAMTRSGISLASYRGAFCWDNHGRSHPLRVEQMKDWLNSDNARFVGTADISRRVRGRQKSYQHYATHRGIIAWRNFHGRGNQGDHIDLWNGETMAYGANDYFERSEEIWHWRMD